MRSYVYLVIIMVVSMGLRCKKCDSPDIYPSANSEHKVFIPLISQVKNIPHDSQDKVSKFIVLDRKNNITDTLDKIESIIVDYQNPTCRLFCEKDCGIIMHPNFRYRVTISFTTFSVIAQTDYMERGVIRDSSFYRYRTFSKIRRGQFKQLDADINGYLYPNSLVYEGEDSLQTGVSYLAIAPNVGMVCLKTTEGINYYRLPE